MPDEERMVERVTTALQNCTAWSSFWGRDDARIMARAAIEAMREPAEGMFLACWPLYHPWGENAPPVEDRRDSYAKLKAELSAYLNAMIDAAIAEHREKKG